MCLSDMKRWVCIAIWSLLWWNGKGERGGLCTGCDVYRGCYVGEEGQGVGKTVGKKGRGGCCDERHGTGKGIGTE